jgi:hypothetical protein
MSTLKILLEEIKQIPETNLHIYVHTFLISDTVHCDYLIIILQGLKNI